MKKSSQSKRLAKKREKEKQKNVRTDGDSNKYESNMPEVRWTLVGITHTYWRRFL